LCMQISDIARRLPESHDERNLGWVRCRSAYPSYSYSEFAFAVPITAIEHGDSGVTVRFTEFGEKKSLVSGLCLVPMAHSCRY